MQVKDFVWPIDFSVFFLWEIIMFPCEFFFAVCRLLSYFPTNMKFFCTTFRHLLVFARFGVMQTFRALTLCQSRLRDLNTDFLTVLQSNLFKESYIVFYRFMYFNF